MVYCCVVGCCSISGRDKVRFFQVPSVINNQCDRTRELSMQRRMLWLKRINRKNLKDKNVTRDTKVCDRHFISGQPSKLFDHLSPDWAPVLALGYEVCTKEKLEKSMSRYVRTSGRIQKKKLKQTSENNKSKKEDDSFQDNGTTSNEVVVNGEQESSKNDSVIHVEHDTGVGCNTDILGVDYDTLMKQLQMAWNDNVALRTTLQEVTKKLDSCILNEESFTKSDERVKFYTGLPNFFILKSVFELITEKMDFSLLSSLTPFQEFLVVLIRLRLNLLEQDLAYRFCVTQPKISTILSNWLPAMANRLRSFIRWPDRASLRASMPQAFIDAFGENVCVLIDCFEIFINRPSSYLPRAASWSEYKHHNTVKFLIGVTPQGVISFISKAWVGRTSDKEITENCGILNNLIKGDVVLADRGFNISDDVALMYAKLVLPAFTKGKPQLSYEDVESTRKVANLRIHVERVIGLLRNKYHILQGTQPIETLTKRQGEADAPIDYIVTVCCALTNLCPSVVIDMNECKGKK